MKITFTAAAEQEIKKQLPSTGTKLKLVYDSEGCGCAVSGVPQLWLVDGIGTYDLKASADPFELLYEKRHEIFFDDEMKLDYSPERKSFVLSSNNQIFNSRMLLIRKLNEARV